MENPWKILGISEGSSEEDIKKAFKKQALKHHPDKFTDETERKNHEEKFKEINEAYQQLISGCNESPFFSGGINVGFNDFFRNFGINFGDIFNKRQPRPENPASKIVLELNVNEIINQDFETTFELSSFIECKSCKGEPFKNNKTCKKCNGTGSEHKKHQQANGFFITMSPCIHCNGRGFTFDEKCNNCNGLGKEKVVKRYKLRVNKAEEV